jgi:hypothetical protein
MGIDRTHGHEGMACPTAVEKSLALMLRFGIARDKEIG